jgi:hypothetical protein
MSEAQTYYDGLIAQGHAPESATQYTQQHFPGFVPTAGAPVPAPAPAPAPVPVMGAPMMGTPAVVAPMAAQPVVVMQQPMAGNNPSALVAYVLWFFLGWIGIHHLYIGRGIGIWLLSLITFQGLGLWWLVDLFLIPSSCSKIR